MKKETKTSSFWSSKIGFIVKNLLIALVLVVIFLVVLHHWLGTYTEHGVEVEVPQVTGLTIEEATILLQPYDLTLMVVDSTYSSKVPMGMIVEQIPAGESMAKHHRTVYVVVNARQRKQVVMPSLLDISYRQAENTLTNLGMVVDSIRYEPSAYRDLVLDIQKNGASVSAGDRLTEGTHIVLVVGQGLGTAIVEVPSLLGLNITDCRSLLLANRLTLGSFEYDEEPTDDNREQFVVYRQTPLAGAQLKEGQSVNIHLSLNIEKAIMSDNENEEEEFF